MRILVTGATGFVGRALIPVLRDAGHEVVAAVRGASDLDVEQRVVGDLGPDTDWRAALEGIEAVVHLAARVHVMNETAADPLAEHRKANTEGTRRLGEQAAEAGVRRLVFLSTIKVNGERGTFGDLDAPAPVDPYGVAKMEAEQALFAIPGLEAVSLRPPLVYGPRVKGNFLALLGLCRKAWPLPLGAIDNRRSLIYVGNLCDAVRCCLEHPEAPGRTFLVRDGEDLSTAALIRRLAKALGRPAPLLPVPPGLLRLAGRLTGKGPQVARLLESLRIDDGAIRRDLGWAPPFTVEQGFAETAAWYRETL